MDAQQVFSLISSRRSVRKFSDRPVADEDLKQILEAGRGAPSGTNNQPWRFLVVRGADLRDQLAGQTKYGRVISAAPVALCVFIDTQAMYNPTKDHQSMGACLQNMLLMAHGLGLGAVWLGEILNNAEAVGRILGVDARYELMAVLALGHPRGESHGNDKRTSLEDLMLEAGPA